MEEKLSEKGNPLTDAETNIMNHSNVHIQRGYSRLMGHLQQNYNYSDLLCDLDLYVFLLKGIISRSSIFLDGALRLVVILQV